ncbi:hypothetical protein ACET3Z_017323 [Daucus carota]
MKTDQASGVKTNVKARKPKKAVASKVSKKQDTSTSATPSDQIPKIIIPDLSSGGQGGVFGSYSQPARMEGTPLGIQPQRFMARGSHVTTLRQIEAEANARKAALGKKAP